jgi:hypothetical protein
MNKVRVGVLALRPASPSSVRSVRRRIYFIPRPTPSSSSWVSFQALRLGTSYKTGFIQHAIDIGCQI